MKKLFYIFYLLSFLALESDAAKIDKQMIITKTEDIKYLSQKIANDYLLFYYQPQKESYKTKLQDSIQKLEDDFRFIARNSDDLETKNILDFLSYTKDQIKESIKQDVSKESVLSMLDYSDALLEGASSTLTSDDKDIKLHLMKASKLYLATNLNFDKTNNQEAFEKEIVFLDSNLKTKSSWIAYKKLMDKKCFIPCITTILLNDIESNLK